MLNRTDMFQCGEPVKIKSDTKKYNNHNLNRTLANNLQKEYDSSLPTSKVSDTILGIDGLQVSVVTKAAAISHLVKGVTIGPNSTISQDYGAGDVTNDVKSAVASNIRSQPTDAASVSFNADNLKRHQSRPVAQSSNNICEYENSKTEEMSRRVMKVMAELDRSRREEVMQAISARAVNYEKQALKHREEIRSRQAAMKIAAEAQALVERQQILCERQEVERQEIHHQEQLKFEHEQRVKERNHLIKKAEQRQEEEKRRREEKKKQIEAISHCQTTFVKRYHEILESLRSCKSKKELNDACSSHFEMVKNLTHTMENLVKQCKAGDISPLDVQKGSAMVTQISSYSQIIQEEVLKINGKAEKLAFDENVATQKAEKVQASSKADEKLPEVTQTLITPENPQSPVKPNNMESWKDITDKETMHTYQSVLQYLESFQASYTDLLKDDRYKEFTFKCRKAVNLPLNTIADTSASHLQDKLLKLTNLLSGQTVEAGNTRVSATAHPHGVAYCMDLVAKKFVVQGESVVSSKKEAAFPIAAVIVNLWSLFPIFGKLLLAHFYKACPYLVPFSIPQVANQTNAEYYVILGYTLDDDGKVEKQATYLKRMAGLIRLYAAILVTKVKGQNVPHPHDHKHAWGWLTRTLNMGPQPDVTATLLLGFLEVTGSTMFATYGRQFQKLLHFICTEYFPMMEKVTTTGGPVMRLEVFLEKTLREGRIPPPSGMLPVNFW